MVTRVCGIFLLWNIFVVAILGRPMTDQFARFKLPSMWGEVIETMPASKLEPEIVYPEDTVFGECEMVPLIRASRQLTDIHGKIRFRQQFNNGLGGHLAMSMRLEGMPSSSGFYYRLEVHKYGDVTRGCKDVGQIHSTKKYNGKLTDFMANMYGNASLELPDVASTLVGHNSIFGRSIVINGLVDKDPIGCCVIVHSRAPTPFPQYSTPVVKVDPYPLPGAKDLSVEIPGMTSQSNAMQDVYTFDSGSGFAGKETVPAIVTVQSDVKSIKPVNIERSNALLTNDMATVIERGSGQVSRKPDIAVSPPVPGNNIIYAVSDIIQSEKNINELNQISYINNQVQDMNNQLPGTNNLADYIIVGGDIPDIQDNIKDTVQDVVEPITDVIGDSANDVMADINDGIQEIIEPAQDAFETVQETVSDISGDILNDVEENMDNTIDMLNVPDSSEIIDDIADNTNVFGEAQDLISDVADEIVDSRSTSLEDLGDDSIEVIGDIKDKVDDIDLPVGEIFGDISDDALEDVNELIDDKKVSIDTPDSFEILDDITDKFDDVVDPIQDIASDTPIDGLDDLNDIGDDMKDTILGDDFSDDIGDMKDKIDDIDLPVDEIIDDMSDDTLEDVNPLTDDIKESLDKPDSFEILDDITDKFDDVVDPIQDIASDTPIDGLDDLNDIGDDMKDTILGDDFSDDIGDMKDKIDDIDLPVDEIIDDMSDDTLEDVNPLTDDIKESLDKPDSFEILDDITEKIDDVVESIQDIASDTPIDGLDDFTDTGDDMKDPLFDDDFSDIIDDIKEKMDDIAEPIQEVSGDIADEIPNDVDELTDLETFDSDAVDIEDTSISGDSFEFIDDLKSDVDNIDVPKPDIFGDILGERENDDSIIENFEDTSGEILNDLAEKVDDSIDKFDDGDITLASKDDVLETIQLVPGPINDFDVNDDDEFADTVGEMQEQVIEPLHDVIQDSTGDVLDNLNDGMDNVKDRLDFVTDNEADSVPGIISDIEAFDKSEDDEDQNDVAPDINFSSVLDNKLEMFDNVLESAGDEITDSTESLDDKDEIGDKIVDIINDSTEILDSVVELPEVSLTEGSVDELKDSSEEIIDVITDINDESFKENDIIENEVGIVENVIEKAADIVEEASEKVDDLIDDSRVEIGDINKADSGIDITNDDTLVTNTLAGITVQGSHSGVVEKIEPLPISIDNALNGDDGNINIDQGMDAAVISAGVPPQTNEDVIEISPIPTNEQFVEAINTDIQTVESGNEQEGSSDDGR